MFRRRRAQRVHPDVLIQDAFIKRRYEDLSVCIHNDIKNGRGQYNYYAPWLELKLQSFPAFYREQHSVSQPTTSQVQVALQTSKIAFTNPDVLNVHVEGSVESTSRVPKSAWSQEDNWPESKHSTSIYMNRTLPLQNNAAVNRVEEQKSGNVKAVTQNCSMSEGESKGIDSSATVVSKTFSFHETLNEVNGEAVSSRGVDGEEPLAGTKSTIETLSSLKRNNSSVSSKICTIL